VTGLCDVADALPRVELAAILYPTNSIKQAVAMLYAHIMKFLVRALKWYEEGKIAHAIHSITKPAALRYGDLIKEIYRATRSIADSAVASSQAEQRDMHDELRAIRNIADSAIATSQAEQRDMRNELRALTDLVKHLRESMLLDRSVNARARIDFPRLSDIQLTQALSTISSVCRVDHKSNFQASLLLRDKRRFTSSSKCTPFWRSPELQSWNTAQHSSLILLKTTFRDRHHVRDFCTSVIEQLTKARIAVLWALKGKDHTYSITEIMKSLIHQALSLDCSGLAFLQLRNFLDAKSEEDYVNLLVDIIQHFKLTYIIVEAEVMTSSSASQCHHHLQDLSRRLLGRGAETVVKIIVFTYDPSALSQQSKGHLILKVRRTSRQRGEKLPNQPLQSVDNSPHQPMRRVGSRPGQSLRISGRVVRAEAGPQTHHQDQI